MASRRDHTGGPGIALFVLARDEAAKIGAHLAYHRALGVDRAWVFLDRCTDRTGEIAASFPWVTVVRRDRPPGHRHLRDFQTACMAEALELARGEGWPWFLHLDPDEYACGHPPSSPWRWLRWLDRRPAARASLRRLLARVSPDTEMVVLAPNDVLPTRRPTGAPFHHLAFTLRRGVVRRRLRDPARGDLRRLERPLGHDKGKALVRTAAAVEPESAHRWRPSDGRRSLVTEGRGFHFHYVVVDGADWWHKYRRLAEYPARWGSGRPVSFPKQSFKEAAREMALDDAVAWFDRWLRWPRWRLVPALLTGRVVHDPLVRRVLEGVGRGAEP